MLRSGYVRELAAASYPHIQCGGGDFSCIAGGDCGGRLKLEFHGSKISSDAGLPSYRELDDALGLSALAGEVLSEVRRGGNTRYLLTGLLRQSVFGRLAGYEDVNDAERLARDPVFIALLGAMSLAAGGPP